MLKKYLNSVTDGLKYYLENDKKIKKNQFGTHMWFSNWPILEVLGEQ